MTPHDNRPIGYFCHHQGRGHALRAAAIVNALPQTRPVTIFCARDDIFPTLRSGVSVRRLPSLFEPTGDESGTMDWVPHPQTTHCAPLGWPSIRHAMAIMADWFRQADPVLMISDVSAEVAQLARLCSVPHVCVLQHGTRTDPGHRAAYDGAAGLIAPFADALAQPDWPASDLAKTHFAPGIGAAAAAAPSKPNTDPDRKVVLVVSGAGGAGVPEAPLAVGARSMPDWTWITVGAIQRDWHATPPGNLHHAGWVADVADRIAASSVVVSSSGNSTCHQVLAAAKPWLIVPEWRYFDEQVRKAEALARAGAALHLPHLPSSAAAWREALTACRTQHDPARQRALIATDPARDLARWLEELIDTLWAPPATAVAKGALTMTDPTLPGSDVSVLTIARGRQTHLTNLIRGLTLQTRPITELVIGVMQGAPYEGLPDTPFPIRQILIPMEDHLPLAEARNAVANDARSRNLIFLDVDCIPAPDLVRDYAQALDEIGSGLVMGEMLYLPDGATAGGLDFDRLNHVGVRHSDRAGPPKEGLRRCEDYRCFWSLTFAMSRTDWDRSGGFDPSFTGYGGEDTDFGRTLDDCGIPIWWTKGARAYHQYHPHAMPPVHHLRSVLRNAERFAEKWGHRTMEHWLYAFGLMGLIDNGPDGLRVLREPGPEDFALCEQQSHMPYAATRSVIDRLQNVTGEARNGPARTAEVERAQADLTRLAAE